MKYLTVASSDAEKAFDVLQVKIWEQIIKWISIKFYLLY